MNQSKSFQEGWNFSEEHMPKIRQILSGLPLGYFMDIQAADPVRDMEQATDLYLEVKGGCLAVRVRRNQFLVDALRKNYNLDWSVRFSSNGHKTEIDKLREGFGDWYFYAYSADDAGSIARWWLLDLNKIRDAGILEDKRLWKIYPNDDGTSGGYYSLQKLSDQDCVIKIGVNR